MNSKKTILIVEDEPDLVQMYKEKLKMKGFRVFTVTDPAKAFGRAKQGVDLILLDILMPGMNGFEVLKKLKSNAETKDIPIIVLTNVGSESTDKDREFALSLGATGYMIKSLNTPDSVVTNIDKILVG